MLPSNRTTDTVFCIATQTIATYDARKPVLTQNTLPTSYYQLQAITAQLTLYFYTPFQSLLNNKHAILIWLLIKRITSIVITNFCVLSFT